MKYKRQQFREMNEKYNTRKPDTKPICTDAKAQKRKGLNAHTFRCDRKREGQIAITSGGRILYARQNRLERQIFDPNGTQMSNKRQTTATTKKLYTYVASCRMIYIIKQVLDGPDSLVRLSTEL